MSWCLRPRSQREHKQEQKAESPKIRTSRRKIRMGKEETRKLSSSHHIGSLLQALSLVGLLLVLLVGRSLAQCPWAKRSAELQAECICDFSPSTTSSSTATSGGDSNPDQFNSPIMMMNSNATLPNRMSVQCSLVEFASLLAALRETGAIPIAEELLQTESATGAATAGARMAQQAKLDLLHVTNSSLRVLANNTFLVGERAANRTARTSVVALASLHLSRSRIQQVEPGAFNGLEWSLTSLSLCDNELESLPISAFSRLINLKMLDVSNNRLTRLPAHGFTSLTRLQTLRLADNRLGADNSMDELAFSGLESSLRDLSLKGNQLVELPDAMRRLEKLGFLNLAQNLIARLEAGHLSRMRHLTAINLERNQLKRLGEGTFAGLEDSLSSLSLLGNQLDEFPSRALKRLAWLGKLDLGFNLIERLPDDAFVWNPKLILIALDGNPLETIQESAFMRLETKLQGLSVGGRALNCDCRLSWILRWQRDHKLHISSRERDPQFCAEPAHLRSLLSFVALKPEHLRCPTRNESMVMIYQHLQNDHSTVLPTESSQEPASPTSSSEPSSASTTWTTSTSDEVSRHDAPYETTSLIVDPQEPPNSVAEAATSTSHSLEDLDSVSSSSSTSQIQFGERTTMSVGPSDDALTDDHSMASLGPTRNREEATSPYAGFFSAGPVVSSNSYDVSSTAAPLQKSINRQGFLPSSRPQELGMSDQAGELLRLNVSSVLLNARRRAQSSSPAPGPRPTIASQRRRASSSSSQTLADIHGANQQHPRGEGSPDQGRPAGGNNHANVSEDSADPGSSSGQSTRSRTRQTIYSVFGSRASETPSGSPQEEQGKNNGSSFAPMAPTPLLLRRNQTSLLRPTVGPATLNGTLHKPNSYLYLNYTASPNLQSTRTLPQIVAQSGVRSLDMETTIPTTTTTSIPTVEPRLQAASYHAASQESPPMSPTSTVPTPTVNYRQTTTPRFQESTAPRLNPTNGASDTDERPYSSQQYAANRFHATSLKPPRNKFHTQESIAIAGGIPTRTSMGPNQLELDNMERKWILAKQEQTNWSHPKPATLIIATSTPSSIAVTSPRAPSNNTRMSVLSMSSQRTPSPDLESIGSASGKGMTGVATISNNSNNRSLDEMTTTKPIQPETSNRVLSTIRVVETSSQANVSTRAMPTIGTTIRLDTEPTPAATTSMTTNPIDHIVFGEVASTSKPIRLTHTTSTSVSRPTVPPASLATNQRTTQQVISGLASIIELVSAPGTSPTGRPTGAPSTTMTPQDLTVPRLLTTSQPSAPPRVSATANNANSAITSSQLVTKLMLENQLRNRQSRLDDETATATINTKQTDPQENESSTRSASPGSPTPMPASDAPSLLGTTAGSRSAASGQFQYFSRFMRLGDLDQFALFLAGLLCMSILVFAITILCICLHSRDSNGSSSKKSPKSTSETELSLDSSSRGLKTGEGNPMSNLIGRPSNHDARAGNQPDTSASPLTRILGFPKTLFCCLFCCRDPRQNEHNVTAMRSLILLDYDANSSANSSSCGRLARPSKNASRVGSSGGPNCNSTGNKMKQPRRSNTMSRVRPSGYLFESCSGSGSGSDASAVIGRRRASLGLDLEREATARNQGFTNPIVGDHDEPDAWVRDTGDFEDALSGLSCDSDKSCSPGANHNNRYDMRDAHRAYLATSASAAQIQANRFVTTARDADQTACPGRSLEKSGLLGTLQTSSALDSYSADGHQSSRHPVEDQNACFSGTSNTSRTIVQTVQRKPRASSTIRHQQPGQPTTTIARNNKRLMNASRFVPGSFVHNHHHNQHHQHQSGSSSYLGDTQIRRSKSIGRALHELTATTSHQQGVDRSSINEPCRKAATTQPRALFGGNDLIPVSAEDDCHWPEPYFEPPGDEEQATPGPAILEPSYLSGAVAGSGQSQRKEERNFNTRSHSHHQQYNHHHHHRPSCHQQNQHTTNQRRSSQDNDNVYLANWFTISKLQPQQTNSGGGCPSSGHHAVEMGSQQRENGPARFFDDAAATAFEGRSSDPTNQLYRCRSIPNNLTSTNTILMKEPEERHPRDPDTGDAFPDFVSGRGGTNWLRWSQLEGQPPPPPPLGQGAAGVQHEQLNGAGPPLAWTSNENQVESLYVSGNQLAR